MLNYYLHASIVPVDMDLVLCPYHLVVVMGFRHSLVDPLSHPPTQPRLQDSIVINHNFWLTLHL